jgi:hypothetical protein
MAATRSGAKAIAEAAILLGWTEVRIAHLDTEWDPRQDRWLPPPRHANSWAVLGQTADGLAIALTLEDL